MNPQESPSTVYISTALSSGLSAKPVTKTLYFGWRAMDSRDRMSVPQIHLIE